MTAENAEVAEIKEIRPLNLSLSNHMQVYLAKTKFYLEPEIELRLGNVICGNVNYKWDIKV